MCWSSWVPLPLGGRLWTGYKGSRRLRRGPRRKNKPVKRLRSGRCGTSLSASGFCPKCNKFTPSAATPRQPKYNRAFHKRWSQEHPIHGGVFQPFMPHQQLDDAQVRAGLEPMRGEAVPGCSELILFLIPAPMAAAPDAPHGLVRDRSLDCAHLALGKDRRVASFSARNRVAPPTAWGKRNVAIAQALTSRDVNNHALAVDVADLQA